MKKKIFLILGFLLLIAFVLFFFMFLKEKKLEKERLELSNLNKEFDEAYFGIVKHLDYEITGLVSYDVIKKPEGGYRIEIRRAKTFNEYLKNFRYDYKNFQTHSEFFDDDVSEKKLLLDFEDFEDESNNFYINNLLKVYLLTLKANENLPYDIDFYFTVEGKEYKERLTKDDFEKNLETIDYSSEVFLLDDYTDAIDRYCSDDEKSDTGLIICDEENVENKGPEIFSEYSIYKNYKLDKASDLFTYNFSKLIRNLETPMYGFYDYYLEENSKGDISVRITPVKFYEEYVENVKKQSIDYYYYTGEDIDNEDATKRTLSEEEFNEKMESKDYAAFSRLIFLYLINIEEIEDPLEIVFSKRFGNEVSYVSNLNTEKYEEHLTKVKEIFTKTIPEDSPEYIIFLDYIKSPEYMEAICKNGYDDKICTFEYAEKEFKAFP